MAGVTQRKVLHGTRAAAHHLNTQRGANRHPTGTRTRTAPTLHRLCRRISRYGYSDLNREAAGDPCYSKNLQLLASVVLTSSDKPRTEAEDSA